ncbi:LytTR family DNA-binding domain-containing protein [Blautia hominis]|uniref:Stage 0 sporulation protein A homolog n=1 Tax=Blautia hominis TaxID=2025493 RepID=A0ABQ0BIC2_9FIRM
MVKIGICDDQPQMRKPLSQTLEQVLQLQGIEYHIAEYASGEELTAGISCLDTDILFLDIEMRNLDGIETAKLLRKKGMKGIIIFVTAHPDFVFQGYEVHAFHYILKPYREEKIAEVMSQALAELELSKEQFFVIEQKAKTIRIPLRQTLAFQSDRRKVLALVEGETIDFYGKIDDVIRELPSYFIRIHNRCIVNLNYVTTLEKDRCIMGKYAFPISRTFRQELEIAFARAMLKH